MPCTVLNLPSLPDTSLRELRTAIFKVVWSRRQPLADVSAVLSLLDSPQGCGPAYCVVWFQFRMLRRYLPYRPGEVARVYRLLDSVAGVWSGHGPVHLLVDSAAETQWNSLQLGRERPGERLGEVRLLLIFVCEVRSVEGRSRISWYLAAPQLRPTSGREIRPLLEGVLVGGVWYGFLLGKVRGQPVTCIFCGGADGEGHLFGDCAFPLLVEIREYPELHGLMEMHKVSVGPRVFSGMAGCLCCLGQNGGSLDGGSC